MGGGRTAQGSALLAQRVFQHIQIIALLPAGKNKLELADLSADTADTAIFTGSHHSTGFERRVLLDLHRATCAQHTYSTESRRSSV